MPKRKFLFDTVSLSNFALVNRLDILVARYGKNLEITSEVLDEVTEGVVAGFSSLHKIEELVSVKKLSLARPLSSSGERDTYRELLRTLGPGEASCIALAKTIEAIVVTDDKSARECCMDRNLKGTGTIGILKACCLDETLSVDEADSILASMIEAGFYAPVQRISDLM